MKMAYLGIPFVALLMAQAPDSLSGGAGWVGAGLLGLVLCWLLLKHLPDKDKQLKDFLDLKDGQIENQRREFVALSKEITAVYRVELDTMRVSYEKSLNEFHTSLQGLISFFYNRARASAKRKGIIKDGK